MNSNKLFTTFQIHDKIASETDGLRRLVVVLSSELSKQKHQLEKLKKDISEGLLNAEIAQRTRDAPPGTHLFSKFWQRADISSSNNIIAYFSSNIS